MNISEANAVNHVLSALFDPTSVDTHTLKNSSILLAEKANKALSAGITGEDVERRFS